MRKKTVLITGCSSGGLGYALAKAFQHENFHIFATARDPTKVVALDDVAETTEWDVLPLDVTSETSIKECLEQVRKKTGNNGLDVLVNNAGGAMFGPLAHASVDEGKALYDVNVWGVLAVAKAFTPLLVEARGVMLNISSMAGAVPLAWQGVYNSSKAAVTHLSETLKIELDPLGVRVVTAMVGAINTKIYTKYTLSLPPESWYKPVEGIILKQSRGELQEPFNEDVDITARNVVRDTLRGSRGMIWRGGEAGTAKYLSWMLPIWIRERILHSKRGVYDLKKPIREEHS